MGASRAPPNVENSACTVPDQREKKEMRLRWQVVEGKDVQGFPSGEKNKVPRAGGRQQESRIDQPK